MVLKWHKNSDFSRNFKLLGYRNTVLHGNLLWGKQFLQWPFDKLQSKQKWRKCIKFINSIGMKFLFRQKTDPGQNIHTTPFEWKFNFQGNSTLNICLILTLLHIDKYMVCKHSKWTLLYFLVRARGKYSLRPGVRKFNL